MKVVQHIKSFFCIKVLETIINSETHCIISFKMTCLRECISFSFYKCPNSPKEFGIEYPVDGEFVELEDIVQLNHRD